MPLADSVAHKLSLCMSPLIYSYYVPTKFPRSLANQQQIRRWMDVVTRRCWFCLNFQEPSVGGQMCTWLRVAGSSQMEPAACRRWCGAVRDATQDSFVFAACRDVRSPPPRSWPKTRRSTRPATDPSPTRHPIAS